MLSKGTFENKESTVVFLFNSEPNFEAFKNDESVVLSHWEYTEYSTVGGCLDGQSIMSTTPLCWLFVSLLSTTK